MPLVSLRGTIYGLGQGDSTGAVYGTKTSAPAGIEAVIEYNGLFMNVRNWVDTFLVTSIAGIDDADIRDTRENNPGRHGETPGNAFYGGRTINLQGKIVTKTLWKLRDMMQALRGSFADLSQERPLIFHDGSGDPATSLMIYCKKSQKLDMTEQQTTLNYFERAFSITLRASNPRFVGMMQRYLVWSYSGSSSVNASVFSVINMGNFPSQPYLELSGPLVNPQLINELTGQTIKFTTTIPAGETWCIDMSGPRVYRKSDGASRFNYVSVDSTDFGYDPSAANPVTLIASGLTATSKVESWSRRTYM